MGELFGLNELHVHLDGSMRAETLNEFLAKEGRGYANIAELEKALCFRKGKNLLDCLESFDVSLPVLQSVENIERVAFELVQDLSACGVAYAEIRYCPALHQKKGLGLNEIVRAAYHGMQEGAKHSKDPIVVRQIVTILRSMGEDHGWKMVELAEKNTHYGVVGFDLAGDEYNFPSQIFDDVFSYAQAVKLNATEHAGEVLKSTDRQTAEKFRKIGIDNVRNAITKHKVKRLGHAVAMQYEPALMDLARDNNVAIEVCPTSNIHTGSISDYNEHPAPAFHEAKLTIVPCADNTLFSKTTTAKEYEHLSSFFSTEEIEYIRKQSRNVRFL